jgi:hypothetical protein
LTDWSFWQEQLADRKPETTPGTPHAGFYQADRRKTFPNPSPRVGEPRRKVKIVSGVCAIWCEDGGWVCRMDTEDAAFVISGQEEVDANFSHVCRQAIPHNEYIRKVQAYEQSRHDRAAPVSNSGHGNKIWNGSDGI